jgi:hypothetical protein
MFKERNQMKRLMFLLALGIIVVSCPTSGLAQGKNEKVLPKVKRLSLSCSFGSASSGPANDIEQTMTAAGFGDTSYGFFSSKPIEHPSSSTGIGHAAPSWLIEVHYLIKDHFSIGAIFGNSPIGETLGYHDPLCYLSIDYSVKTYASVFSLLDNGFRLGIGPAWYIANATRTDAGGGNPSKSVNKLGFLLDLGLNLPENSRFFFNLKVQYRSVGKIEIGPYESKLETEFIKESATFPATKVSYNHFFVGVGFGFRL